MKHCILLFLLSATLSALGAQPLLEVSPAVVKKQLSVDLTDLAYEEISKVRIENTANQTLYLRWDKIVIHQPNQWESQICDKLASYPTNATTNYNPFIGLFSPVVLAPGESFDLFLNVQPYGRSGEMTVEIPLRQLNDPRNILQTVVFHLNIQDKNSKSGYQEEAVSSLRVYPNPANDRFFIAGNPSLSRIDVFNTLGRKVRTFNVINNDLGYNIGDLPEGVYLVSFVDEKGKIVRTLRLLKRAFRP